MLDLKIAIIGSRRCGNLTVEQIIEHIPPECTEIISGGAMGVDELAKDAAIKLGIKYTEYRPNYREDGKYAPIKRNRIIVSAADEIIAFWNYKSRGTKSAIIECLKQDKPLKVNAIEEDVAKNISKQNIIGEDIQFKLGNEA